MDDGLAQRYRQQYPLTFASSDENEKARLSHYIKGWEVARKAAALLKTKYAAQRVVLFGSMVDYDVVTRWSDIDLAAYGIPGTRFFAAVAEMSGFSQDFKIDLVDPEDCSESIRRAVESQGVEI